MESVGELLRRERLRQGLDLARVAGMTRISQRYLEAIESGDEQGLPGAFFYRAFVRQYARVLGLDEQQFEPALANLREQAEATQPVPGAEPAPELTNLPPIPTPQSAHRFSGPKPASIILLVAVIIGCGGIYALWQRLHREEPAAGQAVQTPAPSVKASSPFPAPPAVLPPGTAAANLPPAAPASPAPAPESPQPTETPKPVAAQPPIQATAPPQAAPTAAPAPVPSGKLNVDVAASDTVWLSATTDGRKITTVLKPGQNRRFAANERASLFLGNAGGVEITVNGKALGPIGPKGQLRTVVVTPEGVSITNPREKKESPSPPPNPPPG